MRLFIYQCQCRDFSRDFGDDAGHYLIAVRPHGKGPPPAKLTPICPNEPGCRGPVEFIGVYIPEKGAS